MLDDPQVIKQRDPQDALSFAAHQPKQLAHDFGIAKEKLNSEIHNVVFCGMGGSALVAELVHTWPTLDVPYVVCREYNLPKFVNQHTLVICASYSGNTEETLSALGQAQNKKAQIAIIAHGGKLAEIAQAEKYIFAHLPPADQPRAGIFYAYRALLEIFIAAKLAPKTKLSELEQLMEPLETAIKQWTPDMPSGHNYAKLLAERMVGKTPIIYAGPLMYPAAYKFKINVNENAKNTAWCNQLPEFNHNEFIGWSSHPIEKPFVVIDLISDFEHPRILDRFNVSDRLLSGLRPAAIRVDAKGKTALEHMLYTILFSDFATIYMAILNGVNPTPVALVEKLKKELG